MRKQILILVSFSFSLFSQNFPPPTNFQLNHDYVFPHNYYHLSWDIPDTSTAIGSLQGYLLYRNYTLVDTIDPTSTEFNEVDPPSMEDGWIYYYIAAFYHKVNGISDFTDTLVAGIAVSIGEVSKPLPSSFQLMLPFPNPSNAAFVLKFTATRVEKVDLRIYTLNGKLVYTVFSGLCSTGINTFKYAPTHLSSGIYVLNLRSNSESRSRKLIVIK